MLALILMQLIAMIGAAGIMSAVFRRMGQPGVIDEIVAGRNYSPPFRHPDHQRHEGPA